VSVYWNIAFILSNLKLDLDPEFVTMKARYRSLNFWGAWDGSNPLTNIFTDLSVCEEVVSMPAREQDA